MPLYSVTMQFHEGHMKNNKGQFYYTAKIFVIPKAMMYTSGTTEGLSAGTAARDRICQNFRPICNTNSTVILNLHI